MKQIRFESNNKQWFVVDKAEIDYDISSINDLQLKIVAYLDEISEEQASEVVDKPFDGFYPRYGNFEGGNKMWYCLKDKPIESLHSLLKSKGVDDSWINPVIFEVI